MQLQVQAVRRVVPLVDQSEELALLVERFRLESALASVQETEHRLYQVAERRRLLWGESTACFADVVCQARIGLSTFGALGAAKRCRARHGDAPCRWIIVVQQSVRIAGP